MTRIFTLQSVMGVTLLQALALLLPAADVAERNPGPVLSLLAGALMTVLIWENLFTWLRGRELGFHGITTAIVVTVMCPVDLPLWQLVVAISLGTVFGELVFGGRGFGFASPASVSLALMIVSFPEVGLAQPTETFALFTLPGTALLLGFGLISWRVILIVLAVVALLLALRDGIFDPVSHAVALAFGLTFLVADPVSAAATRAGRWLYGALAGGLIVLFSPDGSLTPEAIVFAALLASIFAPLIDHLVVLAHHRRRGARRHV